MCMDEVLCVGLLLKASSILTEALLPQFSSYISNHSTVWFSIQFDHTSFGNPEDK